MLTQHSIFLVHQQMSQYCYGYSLIHCSSLGGTQWNAGEQQAAALCSHFPFRITARRVAVSLVSFQTLPSMHGGKRTLANLKCRLPCQYLRHKATGHSNRRRNGLQIGWTMALEGIWRTSAPQVYSPYNFLKPWFNPAGLTYTYIMLSALWDCIVHHT